MILENADYFVHPFVFPKELAGKVDGMLLPNDDGTYTMLLPAERNRMENLDGYIHEIMHMENDDLYGEKDIREVEKGL